MNRRKALIFLVVIGLLAIGLGYAFLSARSEKSTAQTGSGIVFPEMMTQLSQNMRLWERMSPQEKKQAVDAVIALYKNRDNVAILNSGDFYVGKIDETLKQNPAVVTMDIMTLIRVISVMEYDFYNGENKDDLARKVLGERAFAANQARRQAEARNSI